MNDKGKDEDDEDDNKNIEGKEKMK